MIKLNKKYIICDGEDKDGNLIFRDQTFDEVLCDCVDYLIEEGIDEDAHWRFVWEDVDDEDLENALNDPETMEKFFERSKKMLTERLRECLEERKRYRREMKEFEDEDR